MFWSTETNVLCNNLFVAATRKHVDSVLSPTRLQLIGRGRKPGELDK
jgi:hypothetical protein